MSERGEGGSDLVVEPLGAVEALERARGQRKVAQPRGGQRAHNLRVKCAAVSRRARI